MKLRIFCCGLVLLALLGACSAAVPEDTQDSFSVVDALGRTVVFDALPQRIAITGRSNFMLTDAVYLFPEAQSRVVALTAAKQSTAAFVPLLDAEYAEKARFTVDSGAEEIAAVQPDLVILKSFMQDTLGSALDQLDIPVVYLDLENPEQYDRDLATLGQIFGNDARADELRAFYKEPVAQIAAALDGVDEAAKPRVLILQYTDKGGEVALKVPPLSWIQTQMVSLSGGTPVWADVAQGGWIVVNLEQIAAWDPDWIFVINYFGDVDATVVGLLDDPQWQLLRSVQAEKLVAFPKDFYSWDQPDSRWSLGLTWLAAELSPERFDVDMEAQFYSFFETLYGLERTVVDEQIVPILQGGLFD